MIWLQATPATLLQRIRRRAIRMERKIEVDYLQRLCDAYVQYFHSYDGAPVFAIGTERFNPIDRDADFAALLERLQNFRGRREFLNIEAETPLAGSRR